MTETGRVSDESLVIAEIVHGNKEKYEVLIRKYNQRLYRVGKGILWHDADVEDAMQEAYIKAYQQLARFQGRSAFGTWLTRILINECLMKKRAGSREKTADLSEHEINKKSTDMMSPEKNAVNRELKQLLETAISQLPEKYRLVFVMREVENMSVNETTEVLDITETNVKARLSRAKEMLRNSLLSAYPSGELLDFHLVRCQRIVNNVLARI